MSIQLRQNAETLIRGSAVGAQGRGREARPDAAADRSETISAFFGFRFGRTSERGSDLAVPGRRLVTGPVG